MVQHNISRRHFLGASALGVMGGASLVHPVQAAAEAVGVKPGDLPDLTIKEVKTYVANIEGVRKFNSPENGWIFSMVTNSGIEGNYTDGNRGLVPNWLEWAKATCVGKNLFELLPMIPTPAGAGAAGAGRGAAPGPGAAGAAAGGRGRGGAGGGGGRGGNFAGGSASDPDAPPGAFPHPSIFSDPTSMSCSGTSWARPSISPSTNCWAAPRTASWPTAAASTWPRLRTMCRCAAGQGNGVQRLQDSPGGGQHRDGPAIPKYMD